MNTTLNKKKILKDPVSIYRDLNPKYSEKNTTDLKQLHQKHLYIAKKIKQLALQNQKSSRKIGEAKKAKQPIEILLDEMKKNSIEIKSLKKQLKTLEIEIMHYFQSISPQSAQTENSLNIPSNTRQYKLKNININSVSILLLKDKTQAWDDYVHANKASSIYHLSLWKKLIHETFGHDSLYLYATDNASNIIGILPLTHLNSKLFGNFMVSVPYFNYGGVIADHPDIETLLLKKAAEYAKKKQISHIEYRDDILRKGLPVKTEKINMILPLPEEKELLWENFTPKLRAQIKRPQKENTSTLIGHHEYLDDFYHVFSKNMRDLGTPVYSKKLFKNILNNFPESARIIIIQLNNKPVSAAFLIGYKDKLEIPWASTIKEVNHLSINMLLYWEVLSFAISKKYNFFDFGRSSINAGTYKFKKQWGAQGKESYWHYWLDENTEMPSLNPNNPKYKLVISIWKKLPVSLTRIIGPSIVKNLP